MPFSKVCQYRTEENDLLIVAGYGWQDGVVGHVVSRADLSSPQGRAFTTGEPSICDDLQTGPYPDLPAFYAAHGIVSIIDVIIKGTDEQPYGILEIDNNRQHDYDQHDINFLTGFANNVFEPFFTTKDVGKGSGLGLSMVYGFVKQSNGHIKIYSEAGLGTTVRIYLPQATGLAQPITDELASTSILEGGDETILVVEDDDLVRTFVVGQIQSLGYVALSAVNADAALVVINSAQTIDLLLTDMIMPGSMNGRQLSDAALRRRPSLSVLFTSGYTENTVIHYGRLDAGVLLLAKPYRKSDLARMIRSALGADTKLQPPTPDPVGKGASKLSRTAA